ncbi:AAA family ATPase [Phyllobacterium myrsinacearum]|uniref:Cobaltochelatase CobS n=1 Tax=Phyllobacterium myrsinacearum TaxID=28101 RepID=A0A839ES64_9HYPH|nr:AAA family ATPase [Phyllobacterium myrsinacearum]MBA8881769.1 cobaltochelatase CobS [Phyllobacterium myrsinacearum]
MEDAELDRSRIVCQIDGVEVHSISNHIKKNYSDPTKDLWTVERYKTEYPDAPLYSKYALHLIAEERKRSAVSTASADPTGTKSRAKGLFHEVFSMGNAKAAKSSLGNPIEVSILANHQPEVVPYLELVDPDYVFNIDLTKTVMMALELGKTLYLWGYHGTGKSSLIEQVCARLRRPYMRVQHTRDTEEAHILGQWVVATKEVEEEVMDKDGVLQKTKRYISQTEYQLGQLAQAMIHGMVYCADEYDYAMPGVIAAYQAVLEGKPLVIKDAPAEYRVIKPHPEFRFTATGNTNGTGDETGLYQGTIMQNAAAYSRFAITEEVTYMDAATEQSILMSKTSVDEEDASRIVQFGNAVRDAFKKGELTMTCSPRELINAADNGLNFGGDFIRGIKLAITNRFSRVDKAVAEQFAQRLLG